MAKFRFYQDKEVKTWVRDYFNVEAETLEEAIEYVENMGCSFDEEECRKETKAEFAYRDEDNMFDNLANISDFPSTYKIHSCDLEDNGEDSEVVYCRM